QAGASSEDRQMAQNSTPAIMKAKPAPQSESNQPPNTISATAGELPLQGKNVASMAKLAAPPGPTAARAVIWSVASGTLQRSLDGGRNWENILRPNRPLLCYASRDHDLWTGGQAGALFHSSDSGVTWVRVQPNIKSLHLSTDVTRIDLSSNSAIVLSTGNNETWSSGDGGNTWEKR